MKFLPTFLFSLFLCSFSVTTVEAQLLKRLQRTAERAAENAIHRKVYEKTTEAVEEVLEDPQKEQKPNQQKPNNQPSDIEDAYKSPTSTTTQNENTSISSNENNSMATSTTSSFAAYSKFDFIAGENITFYEDFSRSNIGDFPTGWNTLGSAEIVTTNNTEGKWIKISNATGGLIPFNMTEYPENFTLEMDLIHDYNTEEYAYERDINFVFTNESDPEINVNKIRSADNIIAFSLEGGNSNGANAKFRKRKAGKDSRGTEVNLQHLINNNTRGQVHHVAFNRQGKRMRMYLDGQKIYDIPLAWSTTEPLQAFRLVNEISKTDEFYYVSNIRMAKGTADTRSKLITEGRLVTYGITFATNLAEVSPESYGTLKSIASVLKENPTVNINIIGHTDNDGTSDYNLTLSEKRAAAVKTILVNEFQIDSQRLSTTGKGDTAPVANNDSAENKAKNRRVELVKM